jgi:hypothetical protein
MCVGVILLFLYGCMAFFQGFAGRIEVKPTEESYTSKASFLDRDSIPVYDPKRAKK